MAFKIIGNVDANRDLMYLDWNKQKVSHLQEQLSTGLRLVRASDGTNDLYIADQAKEVQTGLNKGISNLKQALAAVRESEEAASKIYDLLVKVKETLVEIADVNDDGARQNALETIKGYLAQIKTLVYTTRYGDTAQKNSETTVAIGAPTVYNSNILGDTVHVLNYGGNHDEYMVIGNANIQTYTTTTNTAVFKINQNITIQFNAPYKGGITVGIGAETVYNVQLVSNSVTAMSFSTATQQGVETSLAEVEKALKAVRKLQTFLGQAEEMLQNLVENQQYKMDQMHEVESNLRDVDYAKAFAEMNKMNVVLQANVATLAQNNQINQLVTQLMR
jgi:flagellin-like hook-associated protein FlgL